MIRLKLWMVATTVLLCLPAAATAQTVPPTELDQAALTAQVESLTQRLEEARKAEAAGLVSHTNVVSTERKLLAAELALTRAKNQTDGVPDILRRQVALEEEEVKRLEALQGSSAIGAGPLADAIRNLVAAKVQLARSQGQQPAVKDDLQRLVALREAELQHVKEAASKGVVSGAEVAKAEEKLAVTKQFVEEALKPPPTPEPDEEGLEPDAPDLPTP